MSTPLSDFRLRRHFSLSSLEAVTFFITYSDPPSWVIRSRLQTVATLAPDAFLLARVGFGARATVTSGGWASPAADHAAELLRIQLLHGLLGELLHGVLLLYVEGFNLTAHTAQTSHEELF